MEGIKNLIFDFGGVIVNLTRNRCIEAFASLGVDVRDSLGSIYFHKDLFMQLELGLISPAHFRNGIRKLTIQNISDEEIDEAWIAMLDKIPAYKMDLLYDLRRQYNVMLLSNTNVIHWEWAEKTFFTSKQRSIHDYFRQIYLSYELHMLKPNHDIFQYVLKDARIRPEETLFIDDASVNCKAAAELGIHTYIVDPREDWSFLFV